MKNILIFWGICVLSRSAIAQQSVFQIFAFTGSVKIAGQPAKVGSYLSVGQTLTLEPEAYVALVNSNKQTIELMGAGNYSFEDLEKKLHSKTSHRNAYWDEICNELSGQKPLDDKPKVAGVTRGAIASAQPIEPIIPLFAEAYPKKPLAIEWYITLSRHNHINGRFEFHLTSEDSSNQFDTVIICQKPLVILDTALLSRSRSFSYKIASTQDRKLVSAIGFITLENEQLNNIVENELRYYDHTPVSMLVMARFFEDKKLYANAVAAYLIAIDMVKGMSIFKEQYRAFIKRNRFK